MSRFLLSARSPTSGRPRRSYRMRAPLSRRVPSGRPGKQRGRTPKGPFEVRRRVDCGDRADEPEGDNRCHSRGTGRHVRQCMRWSGWPSCGKANHETCGRSIASAQEDRDGRKCRDGGEPVWRTRTSWSRFPNSFHHPSPRSTTLGRSLLGADRHEMYVTIVAYNLEAPRALVVWWPPECSEDELPRASRQRV